MKKLMVVLAWSLFAGMAGAEGQPPPLLQNTGRESASRPNIIWIVLDACRPDHLSCYGYKRPTSPVMDGIARRGVLFENHFAQGLWTPVSVPSYMTGRYFPNSCVHGGDMVDPRESPAYEKLFPDILRSNGYETCCFSTQPFIGKGTAICNSFDTFIYIPAAKGGSKVYLDEFFPLVLEKINTLRQPYFIYLHLMDTHLPHLLNPPYNHWLEKEDVGRVKGGTVEDGENKEFTDEEKRHLVNLYDGSIRRADVAMENIIGNLSRTGMDKNTILLINADHGEVLGEDGHFLGHGSSFDEVMKVPFILAGPGIPAKKKLDCLTENVDIVPTLCELANIQTEAKFDGKSLVSVMNGRSRKVKNYVLSHSGLNERSYFIITRDFKYKFSYELNKQEMALWTCPDNVENRKEIAIPKKLEKKYMKIIIEDIFPKYEALANLKKKYIDIYLNDKKSTEQLELQIEMAEGSAAHASGNNWRQTDDGIYGVPWEGELDPIQLVYDVPPNKYVVYVKPGTQKIYAEKEKGSFGIELDNAEGVQVVSYSTKANPVENSGFYRVGAVDANDGKFRVLITPQDKDAMIGIRQFRLVINDSTVETNEGEATEQLRALGYL